MAKTRWGYRLLALALPVFLSACTGAETPPLSGGRSTAVTGGTHTGTASSATGGEAHTSETMSTSGGNESAMSTLKTPKPSSAPPEPTAKTPGSANTSPGGKTSAAHTETTASGQPAGKPYDTPFVKFRSGLRNTYARLKTDKKLTVAYIGGSITAGASASSPAASSYRAKTTAWLKEKFPEAAITEVNMGTGSAGSRLPVYYMEQDILPHKPDLVFIETAVNDYLLRSWEPLTDVSIGYETIIRKLLTANPACDIVALYTTEATINPAEDYFDQEKTQDEIASYYGIPSVQMGRQLRLQSGLRATQKKDPYTAAWLKLFSDNVHPNDRGHAFYADVITQFLENALFQDAAPSKPVLKNKALPAPKNETLWMDTQYVKASGFQLDGCKNWKRASGSFERIEGYIYTDSPDNELAYTFTGSAFYLYCSGVPSATGSDGAYQYSVDGGPWQSHLPYMAHPLPIVSGLEKGQHTVRIRAGGASTRVPFKVAAFLSH